MRLGKVFRKKKKSDNNSKQLEGETPRSTHDFNDRTSLCPSTKTRQTPVYAELILEGKLFRYLVFQ